MGLGGSALSSVPSTLTRWSEAAKVLDGDSMHDCMAGRYQVVRAAMFTKFGTRLHKFQ